MFSIENNLLKVTVQAKGAELASIRHQQIGLEYLWNADPAYWAKKSPVLFPIVGTLKQDTYYYKGQAYQLPRHGFARDMHFSIMEQTPDAITFSISSDAETMTRYPFPFQFDIRYAVSGNALSVTYTVHNKGSAPMLFSIGAHPAFKVPLTPHTTYEDYELLFDKIETAGRWPISKEGLIEKEPEPLLNHTQVLPLTKALFSNDALVFKNLQSTSVQLRSGLHPHGLNFWFEGFPYLGLWAAPGADFICIEPWCGIADRIDTNQQLESKEGIMELAAGATIEKTWRAAFF